MASCYLMVLVTSLLVAVAFHVDADYHVTHDGLYISPALSPFTGKICEEVECGKGRCKTELGYLPFNFKCECEYGWKRTRHSNEDAFLFLPCIIPICSLDYSCMPAAPPTAAIPYNVSIYDPCHWIYCGEGSCKWNKPYRHTCECSEGYNNALNISFYPCFSDCALGSDCDKLGVVRASNSSSSSALANNVTRAIPFVAGNFLLMFISVMSIVIVL